MQNNKFTTSLEDFLKSDEECAEISKENEKLARQRELTDLAHMCNLETAEELIENFFTLYQDYIKFARQIGNLRMISKQIYSKKTFEEAKEFAEKSNLGEFTAWRLPTYEESELICKLHEVFSEPFPCNLNSWCTSEEGSENYFDNNSPCNNECKERSFILVR
ncbi:hypothetical protein J6Y50_07320 [bacterium]|nr:hypothetical protein [bacterium]